MLLLRVFDAAMPDFSAHALICFILPFADHLPCYAPFRHYFAAPRCHDTRRFSLFDDVAC